MSQRRNTPPSPSRARYTAAAALALAGLAACSADPATAPTSRAAPTVEPSAYLVGQTAVQLTPASSLALTSTQFETYRTSWRTGPQDQFAPTKKPRPMSCSVMSTVQGRGTLGSGGGTIAAGSHRFIVPAGALSASTAITVTFTKSTSGVTLDARPHGLKFARPTEVQFDLSGCASSTAGALNVYYVDAYGRATQVMPSTTAAGRARALTDHFSGFTVGWGVY